MRRLNLAAITVLDNRDEVLPLDPSIGEVAVLNVEKRRKSSRSSRNCRSIPVLWSSVWARICRRLTGTV